MANEVEKWDGTRQYLAGDEVSHHGAKYRAMMPINNPLIQPHATEHPTHWEKVKEQDKAEPLKPAESPATSTKA